MATIKHTFESLVPDGTTPGMLQPSHWNAAHQLVLDTDENFVTAEEVQAIATIGDKLASVVAGTNVSIDATDPANPVINAAGGASGIPTQYATENNVPSGFVDHATSTLTLDENVGGVNDTFAVTIAGTNFPVYINAARFLKNNETVTQVGALSKRYFIYYAPDGTLAPVSASPWDLESEDYAGAALVATVLWDAVNHQGILEEERHHSWRDIHWHHWAHHTVGPQYSSAHYPEAFKLTNPGANNYATFLLSQGSMYDEDIRNDTDGDLSVCNLFYRYFNGTETVMVWEKDVTTPYKAIAGVPQYDNGSGLAAKTNSDTNGYFVSWVYTTNGSNDGTLTKRDVAVVVGQDADGAMTLTEAQNAAFPVLPAHFIIEWKLLYKMIFRYRTTNAIQWISNTDYRISGSLPSGQAPTSNMAANSVSYAPTAPDTSTNVQQAIDYIHAQGKVQSLGVFNSNPVSAFDIANGSYIKFTTGSGALSIQLASPTTSAYRYRATIEITQGAIAQFVTLLGTDANIISSGALMSSGDVLPYSGATKTDIFEFVWNGLKWVVFNALYDVRAA